MATTLNQGMHTRDEGMARIAESLHAMCQPLTALQCRLELGQLSAESAADPLWTDCLRECSRLTASVLEMRRVIQQAVIPTKNG